MLSSIATLAVTSVLAAASGLAWMPAEDPASHIARILFLVFLVLLIGAGVRSVVRGRPPI